MNITVDSTNKNLNFSSNFAPDNALAFMIVQIIVVSVGAPGNAMVVYFVVRKKKVKLSDILILTLALSDGLYCIIR